jgi:hypothetical protein
MSEEDEEPVAHVQEDDEATDIWWLAEEDIIAHLQDRIFASPLEAVLVSYVEEVHEAAALGLLTENDMIAILQLVADGMGLDTVVDLGWGPYPLVWQMADAAYLDSDLEAALFALLGSGFL